MARTHALLTPIALIPFLLFALVVGVAHADITSNLAAHWTFDDGVGDTALDSSGNDLHGTLQGGPLWVEGGMVGGAIQFDGVDDYVSAPHIPLNSQTFTIAMWVNPVLYTNETIIFSQRQASATDTDMHFRLWGDNRSVRMGFYSNDLDTANNIIEDNNWYHLTFWYDFENQDRRIYVDGVQAAQGASTPYLGTSGDTVIGSWAGASQWFRGIIDEVRIYHRALSDEDVVELYNWVGGANAGDDQRVEAGTEVTLSGVGPADATSFTWQQIIVGDEPTVTLADPNSATTTFTPPVPASQIGYILTFRLTVESPSTGTTSDECLVTVTSPNAPVLVPQNFQTYLGHLNFRLEWDRLLDAEDYGVGFKLGPDLYFWFWTSDTYYDLLNLQEGQATVVAVVARNSYGEGPRSLDITLVPLRNYALPDTLGGTEPPSGYVSVDDTDVPGMNNGAHDDNNDSSGTTADTEDYWGYLWADPILMDHVIYFTGDLSTTGGWFTDLTVQYTKDGTEWISVPTTIVPPYSFVDDRQGRQTYERYEMYIPVLLGTGIRIYGTPGGFDSFTSIAELEIYADHVTSRPLIVQGIDAQVPESSTGTIDSSFSFSTRGDVTSMIYEQISGPSVTIEVTGNPLIATFQAPAVDADTDLVFRITGGDGTDTLSDDVTITVKDLMTTAVAGPDQRVVEGSAVTLDGSGSVSTTGTLTYQWTQTAGIIVTLDNANAAVATFDAPLLWPSTEELAFRLDVDDGAGGTSADSTTVRVKNSLFVIESRPGDLPDDPWGFTAKDIPDTITAGDTTYDPATETYTLSGDGNDIWGTADQFRFAYIEAEGDFSVSVCVLEDRFQGGSNEWAKAGIMVRDNDTPGSADVYQVVTRNPTQDHFCAWQWRDFQGIDCGWTLGGPAAPFSGPFWLRIRREGDTFFADYSLDGEIWLNDPDAERTPAITDPVLVGMCLTSHESGVLTTTEFTDFKINGAGPFMITDAYAFRSLPGGYEPGGTGDVSLSVRMNPDNPPSSVTVMENVPAGLSPVPGSVSHGGNIVGNTVTWTLTDGGMSELGYSFQADATASGTVTFDGAVSFPGTSADTHGDQILYQIPSAPQNLAAEMLLASYVSWSASPEGGVAGYRVYRSVNGAAWEEVAFVSANSYKDVDVVAGSTYNYQVAAENATGVLGPLSDASGEQMIEMTVREAEDFNYGGGSYPGFMNCPVAVEAPAPDDFGLAYDYLFQSTTYPDQPNVYRPDDEVDIRQRATGEYIMGYTTVGDWWRYTFDVPAPGPSDPEGGWVKFVLKAASPGGGVMDFYWDEALVGSVSYVTGDWGTYNTFPLDDQIQTTPGVHTLRVYFASGELDIDTVGVGFNWTKPTREDLFADDFETYTTLYSFADLVAAGYTVVNGAGVPDGAWRLWNTTGDPLGTEDPAIDAMTGNYVIADSDLGGDVEHDEELITPPIDGTSHRRIRLDVNYNYRTYPDDIDHDQIAEVDVRTSDDGVTWGDWTTLQRWDTSTVADQESGSLQVDLSALADGKHFQIRFHFYDANYDYWFAVDDIRVSGDKVEAPPETGEVLSLGYVAGVADLTWEAFGGGNYTVDYTSDLTSGTWDPIPGETWPIAGTNWSGNIDAIFGEGVYLRVRSE